MSQSTKSPGEYLKRAYGRVLLPNSATETYTGLIQEFPGCIVQGNTPNETLERLERAAAGWIQSCLDLGQSIPDPIADRKYSGKVVLRLPRHLHQKAAEMAETEKTSLNTLLVAAVASCVDTKIAAPMPMQLVLPGAQFTVTINTTFNAFTAPASFSLEASASSQGPAGTATTMTTRPRR